MNSRLRVALIGAGAMGSNHARVISQSTEAELAYVIDPREDAGEALAERLSAKWAPTYDDQTGIDAVVLAAATEFHHPIAMRVLSNGIPLLVEKPVADGLSATQEVVAESVRNSVPLMCGLLERYNPAVVTARALLENPLHIGAVRHSPYAPRIKTGVAWDLLVHDVDLAIHLFGAAPTDVAAKFGRFRSESVPGADDVAEVLLGFADGQIASVSASRVGQRKVRQLSIAEPDRLIELDLLRRDVTVYHHVSEDSVDSGRGYRQQTVIEIPEMLTGKEPLTAQFERFLALARGEADADEERATILPAHVVIDEAFTRSRRTGSTG